MMREAFVLRLGPETEPSKGHFVGWIEEAVEAAKKMEQAA